jgi:hypothetical protein
VAEKYSKQATPLGYAERNESPASTSICRNMTGNKREIKNSILEEELKAQNGSPTSQNKNRNKSLTTTRRK